MTKITYNIFKIKNNVNNVNFKDVNVNNVITSPITPLQHTADLWKVDMFCFLFHNFLAYRLENLNPSGATLTNLGEGEGRSRSERVELANLLGEEIRMEVGS